MRLHTRAPSHACAHGATQRRAGGEKAALLPSLFLGGERTEVVFGEDLP